MYEDYSLYHFDFFILLYLSYQSCFHFINYFHISLFTDIRRKKFNLCELGVIIFQHTDYYSLDIVHSNFYSIDFELNSSKLNFTNYLFILLECKNNSSHLLIVYLNKDLTNIY